MTVSDGRVDELYRAVFIDNGEGSILSRLGMLEQIVRDVRKLAVGIATGITVAVVLQLISLLKGG